MLVERLGFARAFGLTFAGKRRLFEACGYQDDLTPADYRWRYDRNEIAGTVIDTMPENTWRGGGQLVDDKDPEVTTAFEAAFLALNDRLKIWPTLEKADTLSGLGEFSVVLIGAPGDLGTPLERVSGPDAIVFLKAVGPEHVSPETYVQTATDPRFGQIEFYKVKVRTTGSSFTDKRVHWSRVIHVAEGTLDDEVNGRPKLKRIWNRLDDLEKVVGGGSEAFFQRVHGVKQVDVDPEVELTADDEKALSDELDEVEHGLRRWARTRGVKINDLGAQASMFDKNVESLITLISAGSRIPHRILTGSERGELASSQDKTNFDERVRDRRLKFAGPRVVRQLADRFIQLNVLPTPQNGMYEVEWPQVEDRTDEEGAALAETYSKVNQQQGETVITSDEIRDKALGLPPLAEVDPEAAARRDEVEDDTRDRDDETAAADEDDLDRAATLAPAPWRSIHRAADANRERVRSAFASAFREAQASVTLADLEAAFADESQTEAMRLLFDAVTTMEEALSATVFDRLLDALVAGGRAASRTFSVQSADGSRAAADVSLSFDATNPEAERWARQHAAALIRQVTVESRDAVRDLVGRAFSEGLTARQLARLIKPLIGLTVGDSQAVLRARVKLLEAKPGTTVKVGAARVRIPDGGLSPADVQRQASRYAERLIRQRALTIARTETIAASNEGQRQLWLQAVEKGHLTGREQRTWIVTPDERLCQVCAPMSGQLVGLHEPFRTPTGQLVIGPPAHPRCRCATGIANTTTEKRGAAHVA